MSRFNGSNLIFEICGASHSERISIEAYGLPVGEEIDLIELQSFLNRRAPANNELSSQRREADIPHFVSGLADGKTQGRLYAYIENTDVCKEDYVNLNRIPRPGHADFAAWQKYGLSHDMSGGGEFSGRMTAPLCILGGMAKQILSRRGIEINAESMVSEDEILAAKNRGDSVGGEIFCRIEGAPAGLGGAGTEGLESLISALIFGIPAVKAVKFGEIKKFGSDNNDSFEVVGGKVVTKTNNHGGILGGISTGMPIEFTVTVKPTPSIAIEQDTVNLDTLEPDKITVGGRHDPCIVPRAVPVVEACAAIAILDIMLTNWELNSLEACRARIDCLDRELVELLGKRMAVSASVAEYKAAHSLPVLDETREAEKLSSVPAEYREVFKEIMSASRRKQEAHRNG